MSPMTPSDDERDAMQDRTPETNLPPTKPFIDMKTTLKNMIQDYDTAAHLKAQQKFQLGYKIIGLSINLLRMKYPSDKGLKMRLEEIREELKSIKPPHLTVMAGLQEDMPVEIISRASPGAGVDKPTLAHSLAIREAILDQEYEEKVKEMDFLVQEVMVLCVEFQILAYDFRDEQSTYRGLDFGEEEDEPEPEQDDDGNEAEAEESDEDA